MVFRPRASQIEAFGSLSKRLYDDLQRVTKYLIEVDNAIAGTHDPESPTPILGLCHGVFTDRFIFRLHFPKKTKAVPVR